MIPQTSWARLIAALLLVAAPMALYMPAWLSLGWLALVLWRGMLHRQGRRLPGGALRALLAAVALVAVLAEFGTIAGRDAGVALLLSMTALKLLETRARRDFFVVACLGYFLVGTGFLFSQSLPMALYLCGAMLALTTALIGAQRAAPLARDARLALRMTLQALPVAAALFVLFPRIEGPLWSMPGSGEAAVTGLDDRMEPGSIGRLVRSNELAFRVTFSGNPPPPEQRYWRGPVLWVTDGRRWGPAPPASRRSAPQLVPRGAATDYTVTLEASHQRWLLALDRPVAGPAGSSLSADGVLLAGAPITERVQYTARSLPDYATGPLDTVSRRLALQLPGPPSDRIAALAATWRAAAGDDAGVVDAALRHFREQPFVYTLTPPRLGADPVDQFLFETRRGFCEHYAAAFTVLMRSAGIPARVVTGYLGGELNPLGDFLTVRQSDAHAWAEVWLPGRGWTRVDPTVAVAPERAERAIDTVADELPGGAVRFRARHVGWLTGAARQLRFAYDAVNRGWHQWVLGYDADRQLRLLQRLGIDYRGVQAMALTLAAIVGALLLFAGWQAGHRPRRLRDPALAAWERACARLARRGLPRAPHEGPHDFAARVAAGRPDLAAATLQIANLYAARRYGGAADDTLEALRQAVRAFRP